LFENILYRVLFTASSTLIPPIDLTFVRCITEQYIIILHEVISIGRLKERGESEEGERERQREREREREHNM